MDIFNACKQFGLKTLVNGMSENVYNKLLAVFYFEYEFEHTGIK